MNEMGSFDIGDESYCFLSKDTVGLLSCGSNVITFEVPKTILAPNGVLCKVTEIMEEAFAGSGVKHLTFPPDSCVERFHDWVVFQTSLVSVDIPPSAHIFDHEAFVLEIGEANIQCRVMEGSKYLIQDSNGTIFWKFPFKVFMLPPNIKRCTLRESETAIMESACCFNSRIRNVTFPSSIRCIETDAFRGCIQLKKICFSDNSQLEEIESGAFAESAIREVEFPASLKYIRREAFTFCMDLRKINFKKFSKLEIIESSSFCSSKIKKLDFPSSLKIIQDNAFYKCKELIEISFPIDSILIEISQNSFDCDELINVLKYPKHISHILGIDNNLRKVISNQIQKS